MAKTRPTRILLLKGDGSRFEEGQAAGVITPGMLVKQDSSGNYVAHATGGGYAERLFALEDGLQGKTIEDDYASGDRVFLVAGAPGDVVFALLSGGETITVDEHLTSNGDGTLKSATGTDKVIAVALENVDASDSNDVNERIRVRLL